MFYGFVLNLSDFTVVERRPHKQAAETSDERRNTFHPSGRKLLSDWQAARLFGWVGGLEYSHISPGKFIQRSSRV